MKRAFLTTFCRVFSRSEMHSRSAGCVSAQTVPRWINGQAFMLMKDSAFTHLAEPLEDLLVARQTFLDRSCGNENEE